MNNPFREKTKLETVLRRAAALSLITLTCAVGVGIEIETGDTPGISELKTVLLTGSLRGRERAAMMLAKQATPESFACLFDALANDDSAYIAADALEARVKQDATGMADLLKPGLKHPHWRARMLTAFMLSLCADTSASGDLAALLTDKNFNVRTDAAHALRTCGDTTAVKPLIAALKDAYPLVRLNAAAALGVIGDKAAVPALIEALNDPDAAVNAARALGKIGDPSAGSALLAHIRDARPRVAWASIDALGQCAVDQKTIDALNALAKETDNERVKASCEAAVTTISGRITE